jgi:hypothetical protein
VNPNNETDRVDEVARHYVAPRRAATALLWLFYSGAFLSLTTPYIEALKAPKIEGAVIVVFLIVALAYFIVSQGQQCYWLWRAEHERARRLISDGLGAKLSHDHTHLYYNNSYRPSIQRLGANLMENSLFGRAVTSDMLQSTRIRIGIYFVIWFTAFAARHNDLKLLVVITQLLFSAGLVADWINLEVLHARFERVFEELHGVFRSNTHADGIDDVATILLALVSYQAAKSAAGTLLDETSFTKISPEVTKQWAKIRADLNMDHKQLAAK